MSFFCLHMRFACFNNEETTGWVVRGKKKGGVDFLETCIFPDNWRKRMRRELMKDGNGLSCILSWFLPYPGFSDPSLVYNSRDSPFEVESLWHTWLIGTRETTKQIQLQRGQGSPQGQRRVGWPCCPLVVVCSAVLEGLAALSRFGMSAYISPQTS